MSIDRFRKHSIPLHAHPAVVDLYKALREQDMPIYLLADRTDELIRLRRLVGEEA